MRHDVASDTQLLAAWLGRVPYEEAWGWQRALVAARRAGAIPDVLLLLEHPPVYTLGRRGRAEHVLATPEEITSAGARVLWVDRGGDATFHGPGQLVGYPIVDLRTWRPDAHAYLRALEAALIAALADYGLAGEHDPAFTGVWVGGAKIAAIGVRIAGWVTSHGFALNVSTDLSYFSRIVPCGIPDRPVTSLERELGQAPPLAEVAEGVAQRLSEQLTRRLCWTSPTAGPLGPLLQSAAAVVPPAGGR
ncbi:MAG: lipoyl(octanoyl) transferase LipB [Chloroflexi bacterium]|nr:lipoyl(octanoyl) transferase LipB [Chloroflexota bacterium]